MKSVRRIALLAALSFPTLHAHAHGGPDSGASGHGMSSRMEHAMHLAPDFGKAADPDSAPRTVQVDMSDTMRFDPGVIQVEKGTPVRFSVKNTGKVMHEMVLGTAESLADHKEMMEESPNMDHGGAWMAHVPPGETREMGWTFTEPGEYLYGCLIPGHFEAGMVGRVIVR